MTWRTNRDEAEPTVQKSWQRYPRKVVTIELAAALQPIPLTPYRHLHGLLCWQGTPLGWLQLENLDQAELSAQEIEQAIHNQFGKDWLAQKRQATDGKHKPATVATHLPAITVIVCTHNRTQQLQQCLSALLQLDYPAYEILVIDNAPSDEQTANLLATLQATAPATLPLRYMREDRPGLDWARNRGICEATHAIVAFTDDDARPDKGWLRAIASAMEDPAVAAVTGPVLPAQLESEAQTLFELAYGGMSHGFQARLIERKHLSAAQMLWSSSFGVGANMAFRRQLFTAVGLFDPALDVGTESGGGGDIEMFHRAVAQGQTLLYTPAMLVWHQHRTEMSALARQLFDNGRGFGSYLWTAARNRTLPRLLIFYLALRHWFAPWLLLRLLRPNGFPRALVWKELCGALYSPFAYRSANQTAKKMLNRTYPYANQNFRS